MRHQAFLHWIALFVALMVGALILFSSGEAWSQQNAPSFPEDQSLFFAKLDRHFAFVQKSKTKEADIILQKFKTKWQSGFFSEEIKARIYLTSNKMLSNKMSALPFFCNYFNAVIHLVGSTQDNESVLAWTKAAHYILDLKNYREFTAFTKASDTFFTQNIIFRTRTLKWKVSANEYSILFQNDSLKYVFPKTDLICFSTGDTTKIINTQGEYLPITNTWLGVGGIVNWTRADYPADSVYAVLKQYSIPMQYSKLSADSASFYNLYYFQKPIIGKLEEQVMASRRGSKAIYPKFKSYEKSYEIPNIFPNIDFRGGVLFEGAHLLGFGDESTQASLIIRRNDTAFVKIRSTNFSILPNKIRSAYASVSICFKNDSIYHSGLQMNYSKEDRLLSFFRDNVGLTANPFYNTYHQINMYTETVYWKMDEDQIFFDMIMGLTKNPAQFESFHYFSKDRFNRLQGIDVENPLQSIKRYHAETSSNIIYFDEYAQYLRKPIEQIQLLLLKLARQGFLIYDAANERAELTDKVDFYMKANSGESDSDVIRFESKPNRNDANAILQIDDFDLKINGLDRIILSDSQNLIIEPTNRSIVLKKNKHFKFDGKITAGRISFATTNSTFNYDEFKMEMPSIDSLWFWVKGKRLPNGSFERKNIQSAIHNLSGDLLIDHPNNKSGRESNNEYPIFNSKKDSYVYYNKKNIQSGVYTKDRFYFHVNPFTFSSLISFDTDDIAFEGYLASAGIFPDISQVLTVQKDYSLGFTEELPPEGIMAFGNKGWFYNKLNLSNQGLKGDGVLTFINSTTKSNEFLFLPDSMNVFAQTFALKPTVAPVEFPRIDATKTYQHWMPYKEIMQISSIDGDFSMYDNETSFSGTLFLDPTSLSGKGDIHFKVAKMHSDIYTFKNQTFESPKTIFKDEGNILNNFSARTDYTNRTISFVSKDESSKIDFLENLYMCYMDKVTWYMDSEITDYASNFKSDQNLLNELTLRQLADTKYAGSDFISTHPRQDSLSFISTSATFNSTKKIIEAKGVHYIKIADAVIFPYQASITILKNAKMIPLENSKIITNAVTKYHEINNATVNIESRKLYSGAGDYIYIDRNLVRYPIHFKEIKVDSDYQTIAQCEIFAEDNFKLSPEFYFRGITNFIASRKSLEFDGGFRIANKCVKGQNWIKFSSLIDPENIMIPIAIQPIVPDVSRQQKFVGILHSSARQKNYSAFLSNKIAFTDPLLLTASGFITYDDDTKEFRISSKEKLNQIIRPDNYFSLKTDDCSTYGEGKINLGFNSADLTIESYGNISLKDSIADLRLGAGIKFHFSTDALKHIYDQFAATTVIQVDNSTPFYSKMIAGFLGMDETEQYLSRQIIGNKKNIPDRLKHTIFLNDLKMKWDAKLGAYISNGKIGIEYLGEQRVNALVDGNVEIKTGRTGAELTIFFKISDQWYFFKYSKNVMEILSSNAAFNEMIKSDMESKVKEIK